MKRALLDTFKKLAPQVQVRNPVMFIVYIGAILTTGLYVQALAGQGEAPAGFILAVSLWLWFLDKTGTVTLGNRQAASFLPAHGVNEQALMDAAQLASLADETPEGRSIVVLAKERFGLRQRDLLALGATFVPFSAHTRMSGINLGERQIRKGPPRPSEPM
jgi:high-affinity K+ transport system ATPase subunit B